MKKSNGAALIPIYVFLVLYLGLGILFEYVLKIPMGFYNIPIVVAFMVAIFVACLQNRKVSFDEKLQIMANGLTDKNIITMLLIFLTAGIFVGVVGRSSAESVAYFMLSIIPARFSVAVLFVVACFVSTAMGTSDGTITLLTPIVVAVADASGFNLPLCVASIMGGAMFGDNLSFISDTTIAACNGQGCAMKDKFRANFWIAFPAAIVTLIVIFVKSFNTEKGGVVHQDYNIIHFNSTKHFFECYDSLFIKDYDEQLAWTTSKTSNSLLKNADLSTYTIMLSMPKAFQALFNKDLEVAINDSILKYDNGKLYLVEINNKKISTPILCGETDASPVDCKVQTRVGGYLG